MKPFYTILGNSLVANLTNLFIWSTLIYWAYLETDSVVAVSLISGIYLVTVAFSGFWFGSIVDHYKKKTAIVLSSLATLFFYVLGLVVFLSAPPNAFTTIASFHLWGIVVILLFGVIAGNIRGIALPTLVTILVPADRRDRANGMIGTIFGLSFAIGSVLAGFGLGFFGMQWVLIAGVVLTTLTLVHLVFINIPEPHHTDDNNEKSKDAGKKIDIRGTIAAIRSVPGLFSLILFTTFNNFLGGIFMALMDAYGLSLVSVQVWGTLWGILSFGFILGGLYIAKYGLGKNPVRTLFNVNMITWSVCIVMAIQPSIVLLGASILIYLCFGPFIEASEQTVIQKVVAPERQGRVFGFAQSIEQAASPVTAFIIGPIAQFIFIPFMTTGKGVDLIGSWYGVGPGRGIGLVFTVAGIFGLLVTLMARRSRATHLLATHYEKN